MINSKTMWFAAALAAFGALQVGMEDMQHLISPAMHGWINMISGVCVAVLRALTTVPLSEK